MTTKEIQDSKFGEFKPFIGTTGSVLYVLKAEADYFKSMNVLDNAGLRLLRRTEILPLLMDDEMLKNPLKGYWFYLEDNGLKENGLYTIDEKKAFTKIQNELLSIENKVHVWKGINPLSLAVLSDMCAIDFGRRFDIDAFYMPSVSAPIIIGIPKQVSELEYTLTASLLRKN